MPILHHQEWVNVSSRASPRFGRSFGVLYQALLDWPDLELAHPISGVDGDLATIFVVRTRWAQIRCGETLIELRNHAVYALPRILCPLIVMRSTLSYT